MEHAFQHIGQISFGAHCLPVPGVTAASLYPADPRAEQDSGGLGTHGACQPELWVLLGSGTSVASPYLHGPGVHVGEHFFPGQRVLVISKCFSQAFLEVNPRNLYEIWSGLGTGLEIITANHLIQNLGKVERGPQAVGSVDYLQDTRAVIHSLCHTMSLRSSMLALLIRGICCPLHIHLHLGTCVGDVLFVGRARTLVLQPHKA